jgi:glycopeptide antibiotics resistance protein
VANKPGALAIRRLVRPIGWLGMLAVTAWLLSMTLVPGSVSEHQPVHLVPFSEKIPALKCLLTACGTAEEAARFLWIDLLGNVAVFLPLGFVAALATLPSDAPAITGVGSFTRYPVRWWLKVVTIGFGLSLGIEIAQLAVPGRVTDVDDVILNALGTCIGAVTLWAVWLLVRRMSVLHTRHAA